MRSKFVAQFLKFRSYVAVIVDFTIEDNSPFSVILKDGLIATLKINDFETGCAERKQIGGESALLIGTTWKRVATMSRTLSGDGLECLCVNPAIPHNLWHPFEYVLEQNYFDRQRAMLEAIVTPSTVGVHAGSTHLRGAIAVTLR